MKMGMLWAAAIAVLASGPAQAAARQNYSAAGCGVGAIIFEGKNGKTQLVLAATTNGMLSNTFGISSETMGCTADGVVKADKRLEVFAAVNLPKLSAEMARGGGQALSALGTLLGVKDEKAFFTLTQARYEKIFPDEKTGSDAMLRNLKTELAAL